MEMEKVSVLMIIGLVGLSVGYAASNTEVQNNEQSYCDKIEDQVRENGTLKGVLACVEPGVISVNLSDEVKNNSELRCVCRHSYKDTTQIIPVSISN